MLTIEGGNKELILHCAHLKRTTRKTHLLEQNIVENSEKMKKTFLKLFFILLLNGSLFAQADKVFVQYDDDGMRLIVNGRELMINGMNWDYVPIGTTITDPGIWRESDDVIKSALDSEMSLLKNMGVNAIRTYNLKPKWVKYIYENYGIYTMLNTTFGAYGLTINGEWVPSTDYSDPKTLEILIDEARKMAIEYRNTPGLLLYMLGNENNYHLSWSSAETEDIPIDDKSDGILLSAKALYRAFNEATKVVKEIDLSHPVAICNGDLLYLDIVKEECTDIDIYGTNMYRGSSFGDAFLRVRDELNLPILFTEFGADAFNARDNQEDQFSQAHYDVENWKDIYMNAAGLGMAGNSIGGFTFQFSDGWWKYKQTENLDVHDNAASWSNGGYPRDQGYEGANNMNEEWFGICAKGATDERGLYQLYPRAAYYALKEAHQLNPYGEGLNASQVEAYFNNINLKAAELKARGDKASLAAQSSKIRLSNMRAELSTFSTGGSLLTTPGTPDLKEDTYPNKTGFDHMQSYYVGVEGRPSPNMRAEINFNVLGNVAGNPINEIFYENAGRPVAVKGSNGEVTLQDNNRVRVYNAEFEWTTQSADVRGFYRTGHYHWGYEGDFFGLYPEANYGPNLDLYNGEILGMEIDGKKAFDGLKLAFGDQLWWGANPAILLKYSKKFLNFDVTGIFHEDIGSRGASAVTSGAIPLPKTRRATLNVERDLGSFGFQLGGIWGGQPLNGRKFQFVKGDPGNYVVYTDEINADDNWGAKAKITFSSGPFNWYALGATTGLVANGGADQTQTFTGWKLRDNGSGNQNSFLTGFTFLLGNVQIAPNFLWQEPLVAAVPNDAEGPAVLRNIQDDPFAVRGNRKTTAGELLITYDPTPGTWFYTWDNDRNEDAKFAFNLDFIYRHLPTTQDAAIGFGPDRNPFAFSSSVPAEDLWEVSSRIVSKVNTNFGLVTNLYGGNAQANGSDPRLIERFGGDIRMIYKKWKLTHQFKFNDWGPFDYHRDFNLTYPVQLMLDLSTSLGKPGWFISPNSEIGIRGIWRSLDQYSPRYAPTAVPPNTFPPEPVLSPVGFDDGQEWEIRTYVNISIGN